MRISNLFGRHETFFFARACAYIVMLFLNSALLAAPADRSISDLKSTDSRKKFQAIENLSRNRTTEAGDALSASLGDPDPHVKLAVLDTLAAQHDSRRVPAIAGLLADSMPVIRQRAARTMGMIGGQIAEALLLSAFRREQDPAVRSAIVQALSICGSAQSVPDLQAALTDARPGIRANAAQALGRIPGPASLRALQSRGHDADPNVRRALNAAMKHKAKEAK